LRQLVSPGITGEVHVLARVVIDLGKLKGRMIVNSSGGGLQSTNSGGGEKSTDEEMDTG